MVSEGLAGVHVRDVQLHHPKPRPGHRVVQRNAGMGVGTGVDHRADEPTVSLRAARFLHPFDQLTFVVGLPEVELPAELSGCRTT